MSWWFEVLDGDSVCHISKWVLPAVTPDCSIKLNLILTVFSLIRLRLIMPYDASLFSSLLKYMHWYYVSHLDHEITHNRTSISLICLFIHSSIKYLVSWRWVPGLSISFIYLITSAVFSKQQGLRNLEGEKGKPQKQYSEKKRQRGRTSQDHWRQGDGRCRMTPASRTRPGDGGHIYPHLSMWSDTFLLLELIIMWWFFASLTASSPVICTLGVLN